jgi:hypothetical protein
MEPGDDGREGLNSPDRSKLLAMKRSTPVCLSPAPARHRIGSDRSTVGLIDKASEYLDSLWLVCLLTFAGVMLNRPNAAAEGDLWWHIRTGNWILQHHAVPIHDTFAAYTAGKRWIDYTWLFDVLTAKIYSLAGLHGTLILSVTGMLACLGALVMLLMLYISLPRAVGLAALAMVAIFPLDTPRPWLFTIFFFIAELFLLLQARERGKPSWLLPIVPLLALWANVHVQFIYGLSLIGLFAVESSANSLLGKRSAQAGLQTGWLWALLGSSALATLVNPYGWRLYEVVADYAGEHVPLWFIQEMQAPQFRSFTDWAALLMLCCAIFALAGAPRKSPLILALLAVSCVAAFHAGRDVWFLAVSSALALAWRLREVDEGIRLFRWSYWLIALPLSGVLVWGNLHSARASESTLQKAVSAQFPERASAYIESHNLRGPLYNSFDWGGYLIWRLPDMPVSVDGRANLHGDARLARFADSWMGKRDWAGDHQLMKANTIILERDSALASILRSDARFRLAYEDEIASVFQPGSAEPQGGHMLSAR